MLTQTNTFKKNLILFLAPLLIPLLILGAFSIVITRHYIQNEINKNNFNVLQQTKQNLELIFDELDSLNLHLGTNPEIVVTLKKILDSPSPVPSVNFEEYQSLMTISNFINAPANARPYIHSIYVYFENNQQKMLTTFEGLTNLNHFFDQDWYESYLRHRSEDRHFWLESRQIKQYSFHKDPTAVLTIYRKIYSTSGHKTATGVIVLNIYTDYLKKYLNHYDPRANPQFLVADEANHILLSNTAPASVDRDWLASLPGKEELSQVRRLNGVASAVSQIYSEKYRLRYVSVIPQKVLYKIPSELQTVTVLLLLLSFGLGLALTYYLTKKNYQQVQDIVAIIDSARYNRPVPEFPASVNDEYSYIAYNIVKTFIEQNYLKVQLSERKYRLQVMEMLALQSQINPHFLFNTLETIKWKMMQYTAKPNQVTKMLENLSEILHYSLESPGKPVTMAEEILNTRNYVKIQKIRYRNKFDVLWEYSPQIKKLPVIRLILQPLLENCIYHGIKEKEGKSLIKIKIRRQESSLEIAVIDNGIGMRRETLRELIAGLRGEKKDGNHIGLYNTNKRLVLTYGEAYALRIWSKFNCGTVVRFRIPIPPGQ
jgi:two-component system sensor histidine kinase YesM